MKTYFKILLNGYAVSLAACLICRVALKLWFIDMETGFYNGGGMFVFVQNITLAAFVVGVFLSNRLKTTADDFAVSLKSPVVNVMAALCGISMIMFAVSGSPDIMLEQGNRNILSGSGDMLNLLFGSVSGAAFLYFGIAGVFGKRKPPPGVWLALTPVWMVLRMITRYNGYTTVLTISDHLLVVLFMVSASLFLLGHARTICGYMRRDGRNYAIPSGLSLSLFGFVLTIPGFADILAYGGLDMPAGDIFLGGAALPSSPLIGVIESVFIFTMSLYALCFVIGLMRSVKRV
ncbi:MAG: hypothetical protein FWG94_09150 [Oscillospiraceae bacterium]|nr:hypothetical protein [Oscillospiraceae bacterium]